MIVSHVGLPVARELSGCMGCMGQGTEESLSDAQLAELNRNVAAMYKDRQSVLEDETRAIPFAPSATATVTSTFQRYAWLFYGIAAVGVAGLAYTFVRRHG